VGNIILKRWVLAAVAGVLLGTGAVRAQGPAPIFTKNTALRLPVQLDERSKGEVSEVKLFVRGPAGRWECVQTAPPSQSAFDFRAPADGEYRFTFVTVDRRGTANPGSVETSQPHRIVIVDATPPDVAAQPIPFRGEKALQCQVRDANPDWATVRVVYLSPENTWLPLVVAAADTPTVFRVPTPAILEGKIRVTVADRAGNRTTREIDLADPTAPLGLPKATVDRGRPDPSLMTRDEGTDAIIQPPTRDRDIRGAAYPDLPKAPKADLPDLPPLPDIPGIKGPTAQPEIKLPEAPGVPSPRIPDPPPSRGAAAPFPVKVSDEELKIPDLPAIPAPDASSIKPPADIPAPGVVPAKATAAHKPTDPPPVATRTPEPAETGAHPILNSRTCSINYQVDGPAKFATRIDFWATADGGRSWMKVQDASGGSSPARLTLPGDGVYGIRIRPGGGVKPPEPGEDADCVVEVDTTRPVVTLNPPTVGAADGMMVITWEASDKHLLSNAINLYYASRPDGPWEVIVHGYKNTGSYRWDFPTTLPGPVYLRLEATDKAGNVGRYELPTPVALEGGKQRVKVIGVGPAK
jgi:hypothetical protein